ncbi:MAG: hypothetical protein AABW51_01555 [Nanoarchaeota archaeon]
MVDYFDKIRGNKHLARWYDEHASIRKINKMATELESKGYVADSKSGLFLRKQFSDENIQKIGRTIIDVGFLRPSDLHFHDDVTEFVKIIWGGGCYFSILEDGESQGYFIHTDHSGIEIPVKRKHAFSPSKNGWLELRVVCDGILDPDKEYCVIPFQELEVWKRLHTK